MIRYTTPTLTFKITSEFDFSKISEVWFTIANFDTEETFKYSAEEVAIDEDEKTISVMLSQEDTSAFEDGEVEVQLRVLDENNLAYATDIFEVEMKRVLKDGVITDGTD